MMSQCLSIGTAFHKDLLKDTLGQELKALKNKGLDVRMEETPVGGLTFLACCISGGEQVEPVFKHQIAGVITDLIVSKWQDKLLQDIIRNNYYYFDDEEKSTIYDYARKKLNHNAKKQEKNRLWILRRLTEYLSFNSDLVIDGFVRFRLKEYVNDLYDVADQAVDDFLSEREYNEFIQLLRYFVEIQEPRADLVNVVLRPDGVFQLYDEKGGLINSDYLKDFMVDLAESEINYEDLLISALITISPKKITVHQGNGGFPAGTLETICKVFSGRVDRCPGCTLCRRQ
ncbi:putative sporulation protein YtxC [Desulfallas thermosapovorans]|uniref:Putative sporulation protein YtxC n=1 Tax=Desulfallas thermosapovorans DSM 6562 TaxID=1121431 RepID=A0A5S4ZPQ8_9FIRM|nr:putative sporulation protein YtxC [Desulfallas thermosapovorans]TYO94550.1 putative sporulation protein YtxC [Desulfallas thermosapovorans DSM 6562]